MQLFGFNTILSANDLIQVKVAFPVLRGLMGRDLLAIAGT